MPRPRVTADIPLSITIVQPSGRTRTFEDTRDTGPNDDEAELEGDELDESDVDLSDVVDGGEIENNGPSAHDSTHAHPPGTDDRDAFANGPLPFSPRWFQRFR